MKPYPKYKDSGIEWIGEVPEGWEVKRLKYVATINPSRENSKISKDSDELAAFLPMEKVNEDGTFETDLKRPINMLWNGFTYFEEHDTIFAKITPCFENGKGAYLINLGSSVGFGSTEFHVLRAIANTSISKYLYYITRFDLFRKIGESLMIGVAGQKRLPSTFAKNFLIGIPPVLEQQSITAYLDRKTAQIDKIISKKQKLIDLLKEDRAAIINQAVTKGLNPGAPMKDSGVEWLGEIPAHWEVKRLKYIARIILGKMLTNVDKGGYHYRSYLRAQNISWEKVNVEDVKKMWFSKDELHQYRLNKNDLLVSEGGEVGRTSIWGEEIEECYIQNSVHKVTMEPINDPLFFLYTFCLYGEKGVFESVVNRISIAHLTKEKLKEIPFPMPPTDEQRRISKFIRSEIPKIDQTTSKIEKQINLLKEFRTALISETVTGKIDVRDEELK